MKTVIKNVLYSLKNEPSRWSYDSMLKGLKSYKYKLYRDDGLSIWVGNKAYGLYIYPSKGGNIIGGVYFWWTLFGGAPWQHKIYKAYKEWDNG